MGRTIAFHFFHPNETGANHAPNNSFFYFDKIPIKFDKIYRSISVELEHECKSLIISKANCLPQITVLDKFLNEFKNYITQNKRYASVKYDINYQNDCPKLLTLIKSHKNFMHYLHIPKKENGIWFCEGRFFTPEELDNREDRKTQKEIIELLEKKKINYNKFFEEWVGLIFHLAAEYLLFKKELKVIFFSCDKCHRPGVFIYEKLKEREDPNKIFGTINVVDTIIYNCINYLKLNITEEEKCKNNIIVYNEYYNNEDRNFSEIKEIKYETEGAFIIVTNEVELDNLIKEFKLKQRSYKFNLIIIGKEAGKIIKKIYEEKINYYFDRTCIYKLPNDSNYDIPTPNGKTPEIYNQFDDIKKFIHSRVQDSEIYPTFNLLTYKDYIDKYMVFHRLISSHYSQEKNSFKMEISYMKDFLLWNPELKTKNYSNLCKTESLLEALQKFEKIEGNEKDIIKLYTLEKGSYYQDFNNWLNNLDPLAIQKTSWFIAAVIYCLNVYSNAKNKGLKENGSKLYRGLGIDFSVLLSYQRLKGELICYPSFTSSSKLKERAEFFSKKNHNDEKYKTIITINYIYKEGFMPNAVDVSEISKFPEEQECLFFPYSFFRIKNIEINHEEKKAEIELDSIGKKEIIETKLRDGFKLDYNDGDFMEVVTEKQS